jgi:hypothetical protein
MAVDAMGLGVAESNGPTAVFHLRNRLHVVWVYAVAHAAQVVDLEALRDRANEQFIGHTMHLLAGALPPADVNSPIAPAVHIAIP